MMNGSKLIKMKRRCARGLGLARDENEGTPDLEGPTFSPLPMQVSPRGLPSELPGDGL